MKTPAVFPVSFPWEHERRFAHERAGCPRSIPWAMVAPHERQARSNHSQTLTRLAERGGLSARELVAVLTDRRYEDVVEFGDERMIIELKRLVAQHG